MTARPYFLTAAAAALLAPGLPGLPASAAETAQTERAAATEFRQGRPWRYLEHLPEGYAESEEERWPLLVYLHGRSVRGTSFTRLKRYGPPSFLDRRKDFPFVTVSPLLPEGAWPAESLNRLLDEWLERYRIDPDRVYLSGVSLGAQGAWGFAAAYPERFAALHTVCAHGDLRTAERLTGLPIWAFHGDLDRIVPMAPHQRLVEAIQAAGGEARFTVMKGKNHGNVIAAVYGKDEVYQWIAQQRRPTEDTEAETETETGSRPLLTRLLSAPDRTASRPPSGSPARVDPFSWLRGTKAPEEESAPLD